MIAIVNSGESGIVPGIFKGGNEVDVLSNKYDIPVIVMNPAQSFVPEHFG